MKDISELLLMVFAVAWFFSLWMAVLIFPFWLLFKMMG